MFQNTGTSASVFRFIITVFLIGWAVLYPYSNSSPAQHIATADNHQSCSLARASHGTPALFCMPDVFACCLKLKTQVTEALSSTSNHLKAVQIRIKSSHFGPLLVYEMLPVSYEVGRSPSPNFSLVGLSRLGRRPCQSMLSMFPVRILVASAVSRVWRNGDHPSGG